MWPIGGSSCDQTLNPKAFGMLPIKIGKLQNASIGALKTEKKKTTNKNLIWPWLRRWHNYHVGHSKTVMIVNQRVGLKPEEFWLEIRILHFVRFETNSTVTALIQQRWPSREYLGGIWCVHISF